MSARCFEMRIRKGHQDTGPEDIGMIPNHENHGLIFAFQRLYAIGPTMFSSGNFTFEDLDSQTHRTKWVDLEKIPFMNTNLQTVCVFGSENIGVVAGIYFDITKVEQGVLPQIRIKMFASKRDFTIERELYPRKHVQSVMCMIGFNKNMNLLSFGLDCMMYKWIIEETVRGRKKVGTLKCIDSWYIDEEAITCAKETRGGRFLITGSFRGTIMVMNPNKKSKLVTFRMKVAIPVNSVEEGFNDPDDSCVYGIGDVLVSIQKFRLTKKQYNAIYGGIVWEVNRESSEYLRRNPRYTALLKPEPDHRIRNYRDVFKRDNLILKKFINDKK